MHVVQQVLGPHQETGPSYVQKRGCLLSFILNTDAGYIFTEYNFTFNAFKVSAGASVSEAASGTAQANMEEMGDSSWIELEAYSASVYYWSEIGEGESSWQPGKFRMFIRRLPMVKLWSQPGQGRYRRATKPMSLPIRWTS